MQPSASAAPLLEAKELTREFDDGQVKALRGVDFVHRRGRVRCHHVGPSGCGKSTLLQLLGALDYPTSGTLLYRGKSLPDHPNPAAYRAREVGFIFQAFHLLPTLPRSRTSRSRCLKSIDQFPSDASVLLNC
jgi:ABC-type lipoprotein export system ATPase subunit